MKLFAILLIGIVLINLWYQSQMRVKVTKILTPQELKTNTKVPLNLHQAPVTAQALQAYFRPTPSEAKTLASAQLKDHLKKITLISLWASWCSTCKEEFPEIERLYQDWQELGFGVISINSDSAKDTQKALDFFKNLDLNFPLFLDPNNEFIEQFSVQVLPTHFLVTETGEVLIMLEGATQWQSQKIKNLIKPHL